VLIGLPVVLAVNFFWHDVVLHWLSGGAAEEWTVEYLDNLRQHMGPLTMILSFCIVPAVTEEIAFRGLMQHWLGVAIKPVYAILVAAALFAALHFSVYSFPVLFLVGILLGWTKMKTQSLYPSMVIHFLHNLAVIELF
jgi:membrane protease YdiL (CAAX protease family)